MFDLLFRRVTSAIQSAQERSEGVAFLKAVATLYDACSVDYLALDIKNPVHKRYLTCFYSSRLLRQTATEQPLGVDLRRTLAIQPGQWRWYSLEALSDSRDGLGARGEFWLMALACDTATALFGITCKGHPTNEDARTRLGEEWSILASYFHNHVLRLNGHDSYRELIMSARELDCLRWTAAGKTAWEASRILGISERTVRFHLNTARQKLNCATTTQAVAMAVARRMITI
jgi:DNA-binding CsgD family transcriptional regulator